MKNLKSKIILIILAVSLIGWLCGFADTQENSVNDNFVLVIRAYKLGYLKGRIAQLESTIIGEKVNIEMDARMSTLEYIKQLELSKEYYKYAEN